MPEPMIAQSLVPMIAVFAECFTAPTFESFRWLMSGWILCIGRHTVTGVIRAANAVGVKHHTSFHRFFRAASWSADHVGLRLLKLVAAMLPNEPLVIAVDDTLSRHTGNSISGASMHRDPLLSTQTKITYHWGHVWVVFAVVLRIPKWNKNFALPVLCRLYRSEKVCEEQEYCFYKKTELAQQMVTMVAEALPNRQIYIVGDNAYTNGVIVKKLPENVHYLGRARMDAALYALPEKKKHGPGRPRVKGERVLAPKQHAEDSAGWNSVTLSVYGHDEVTLQVKVFDAIWYRVSRGRQMRFALIRGWPGHEHDDVLATTDLALSVEQIIELFCLRWSIEVTFHEVKDKLGFEEPENRTELAVERTAPMALWAFTLTVVWYLQLDQQLKSVEIPQFPWYEKTTPAFSDMLAALRRETWLETISDRPGFSPINQNSVDSLLYEAAYAS